VDQERYELTAATMVKAEKDGHVRTKGTASATSEYAFTLDHVTSV
jgi:hypothetical protein